MGPAVSGKGQPRGTLWFNFDFCTVSVKYAVNTHKVKSTYFPTTEGNTRFSKSLDDL